MHKKISTVHAELEDTIAWHFDPKGLFSVKSVYHTMCLMMNLNAIRGTSEERVLTILAAARWITYGPKFGSLHVH
jgi:hypothetical protein